MTDIFKAEASSFYETMKCHTDSAGYRIPNYQRNYEWDHEHINRLIDDCLNGFYGLSENNSGESFAFLGTLILVKEEKTESTFDGVSLSVVDGQQRLTTLVLIACALIENISIKLDEILPEINDKKFTNEIKNWIKKETEFQLERLYECAMGQQSGRGERYPYPRIIREEDNDKRGRTPHESEYNSAIATFLRKFSKDYASNSKFTIPKSAEELSNNYKVIHKKIEELSIFSIDKNGSEEAEFLYVTADKFEQAGIKELFEKTNIFSSDKIKSAALSFASTNNQIEPLARLLLFASYMTQYVILTRVETENENAAFDIFDSLNTTGEPLTAIQTLKPLSIRLDRDHSDYSVDYVPGDAYERIMEHADKRFSDPQDPDKRQNESISIKRQNESKELVVSFALYIDGKKLPKSLNNQRSYLKKTYQNISNNDAKRSFIESLAEVATFRHHCWDKEGIHNNLDGFSEQSKDEIQLCLRFIADMKTSLAIPILCRYWSKITKTSGEDDFLNALKALTAFIVIRRAATGRTKGIDTVLRSLMEKKTKFEGDPLSAGLDGKNTLWSVEDLKVALCDQLKQRVPDVTSKQKWIDKIREIPLAGQSQPLARFMLLAAAHGAAADPKTKGLWSRDNIRPSEENEYLNYKKWIDPKLSTLEHVAPVANSGKDEWDISIYRSQYTKDTLGNLLLLPAKENSSIGNNEWKKKKLFYMALTEKKTDKVEARIKEAEAENFTFQKSTKKMLLNGERLPFLDPIRDVEGWKEELIRKRTDNIADLAWDTIETWLWKH